MLGLPKVSFDAQDEPFSRRTPHGSTCCASAVTLPHQTEAATQRKQAKRCGISACGSFGAASQLPGQKDVRPRSPQQSCPGSARTVPIQDLRLIHRQGGVPLEGTSTPEASQRNSRRRQHFVDWATRSTGDYGAVPDTGSREVHMLCGLCVQCTGTITESCANSTILDSGGDSPRSLSDRVRAP
jgi:hypothetical protein